MVDVVLYSILVGILAWIVFYIFYNNAFPKTTILEYERGILFKRGKFKKVVVPGPHRFFVRNSTITTIDVRPASLAINPQQIYTQDNVPLRVSAACRYEITDVYKAVIRSEDYRHDLYMLLQSALQQVIAMLNSSFVKNQRAIEERVLDILRESTAEYGLSALSVTVTYF